MRKQPLLLLLLLLRTFQTICGAFGQGYDYDVGSDEDDDEGCLPPAIVDYIKNANDKGLLNHDAIARVKVMSGKAAASLDAPHHVSLLNMARRYEPFCSAAIIHPLLLLSAAHCFQQGKIQTPNVQAVVGAAEARARLAVPTAQVREVTQVFKHKKFNTTTWAHDIAILVLNESLEFNDYVRPIPVRDPAWELSARAIASGLGMTWSGPSYMLVVNEIPIIRPENCALRMAGMDNIVAENRICAGHVGLEGMPGSLLTCVRNGTDGEEERYLCGILSWGRGCSPLARQRGLTYPGIYTDVTKYRNWMHKFMHSWLRHGWRMMLGKARSRASDCPSGTFYCPNSGLCIPAKLRCNGRNDCHPLENWDEENCTSITCARGKFKCNSGTSCIPSEYVCDRDGDCDDASDELNCED